MNFDLVKSIAALCNPGSRIYIETTWDQYRVYPEQLVWNGCKSRLEHTVFSEEDCKHWKDTRLVYIVPQAQKGQDSMSESMDN